MMKYIIGIIVIICVLPYCNYAQGFNQVYYKDNIQFSGFGGIDALRDTIYVRGTAKLNAQDNNQRSMVTKLDKYGNILSHSFFADTTELIGAENRPLLVDKFEHIVEAATKKYPFVRKLNKKLNTIALKYFPRDSLTERYFFSKLVEVDSGYLVAGQIKAFAPKVKQSITFLMLDYDLNVKKEFIIQAKSLNHFIVITYLEVIDGKMHIMYVEGGPLEAMSLS